MRIYVLLIILVLELFVLASNQDYKQKVVDNETYCKQVAGGVWKDYKKTYKTTCKNVEEVNQ